MTGPDHYQHAERLLVEAARMMSTEIVAEERAEHILRQAVTATCAAAHSVLALAAATGLSANLDTLDARDPATRLGGTSLRSGTEATSLSSR